MTELNINSEESKKSDDTVIPRRFKVGVLLLSIAVFIGIPAVLLGRDLRSTLSFGFFSFVVAFASLNIFMLEGYSPKRKQIINTLSGACLILNLLAICLIVFCSIHSIIAHRQRNKEKMKYNVMKLAYSIEKDRQLTGLYPESQEVYEKYSDIIESTGFITSYVSFGGKKCFGIEVEPWFGELLMFNSEYSELGVVNSSEMPKDGKWWDPDFDWGIEAKEENIDN